MKLTAKWHNGGESREMARASGWVMVRRPGRVPYTMLAKHWDALPSVEEGSQYGRQFDAALQEVQE